jgi:endonuclease-3
MAISVNEALNQLEDFYGKQAPSWPTDPYRFLVWWHCGYPASDAACSRGWESLEKNIGVTAPQILATSFAALEAALAPGGMAPDLRARRLKEIAARVQEEFGGDLTGALAGPLPQARKTLKTFPSIADPGADRILLFGGVAPIAAVPSNCPHVIVRIQRGPEREAYGVTYRLAQKAIADEVAEDVPARIRAYLLLKRHGQEVCKRSRPRCEACPVQSGCAYYRVS